MWGANVKNSNRVGGYASYNGMNRIIDRAKARGCKIVCIDPIYSETAQRADWWIPINLGTDTALALAMIHEIIKDGIYDKEFVGQYTEGFGMLSEHVRQFPPEWAEPITGISAGTIRKLAREFAEAKPACLCDGNGLDMYANVTDACRSIAILEGICGYVDVPGGCMFLPFIPQSTLSNMPRIGKYAGDKYPLFREIPFPPLCEGILNGDELAPRAMIVHHSNPVLIQADSNRTREALKKLDFLLVDDIFMTATTEIADVVLPALSPVERWGYKAYASFQHPFLACARPIADPPGEARSAFWMEYELAKRIGIAKNYPFHDDISWISYMLKPSGTTFEELEHKHLWFGKQEVQPHKYETEGFFPGGGKMRLCQEDFEKTGLSALPVYREPAGKPLHVTEEFPLMGTNRRPAEFVHTKFHNLKATTKLNPRAQVWIPAEDAKNRAIAEGDKVALRTCKGEIEVYAHIAEKQRPGLVAVDFGWGNSTDDGPNLNTITDGEVWDRASGATPNRIFACQITKL
jgi:anaerobic selenocysteine-containing dehydrogenase